MSWIFKNYQPWSIDASKYPRHSSVEQQLAYIVQYGVLAPSTFNAQPWSCRIHQQTIVVLLNKRRLPVKSDKSGRFGYISLGCFIENIVIAARHFGWEVATEYHSAPPVNERQEVATLHVKPGQDETVENKQLFEAITIRATNRSTHLAKDIPEQIIKSIHRDLMPGIAVCYLDHTYQSQLIKLSKAADMAIWSDLEFRREHVQWVRSNWTTKEDGMPGFGVGVKDIPSLLARPVILSSKFATMQTAKNERSLQRSAAYIVFTSTDSNSSWLDVGRSYQRIVLNGVGQGIAVAPMGQFIEHDDTRGALQKLIGSEQPPQLFCRIGYPSQPVKHSPRRASHKVLVQGA